MQPSLDIIIVNWNTDTQLRECLESIAATSREGFILQQVVVVDNASYDDSANGLDDIPIPLTIIRNHENRGFAAACNQGAKHSKADYLLFLNPDMRLFDTSLSVPIHFMQQPENRQVGICGIQLIDEASQVTRSCSRFPTLRIMLSRSIGLDYLFPTLFLSQFMKEWNHANSQKVDQVMGAFFLMRRSLFESLAGFDERFFVYFEEVDISYRAYKAGCHSYFLSSTQAFHRGGGSSKKVKAARLFYVLRSRIIYCYKHFSWIQATIHALVTLVIEPVVRLVYALLKNSGTEAKDVIAGYFMLWYSVPGFMRNQKNTQR